ncbi:hypothetical protein [Tunturiibacter gelidiferens]|uniref:hypothetical protein n=1 Tax=Tunturiibacter gelidiferens TaxID=3069689 RepID=UPI003D9B6F8C
MARKTQIEARGIALLILVGVPIWIISKLSDSVGSGALVAGVVGIVALITFYLIWKRAARLSYLRAKYQNEDVVQKIMRRNFWAGQTTEQLRDSLGNPPSKDDNLLKTRKREVWKYHPSGRNRYRLRITLDDDVVVAWDQKN